MDAYNHVDYWGEEVWEEGDYVPVTTRMTCIKMGSDESHLNVNIRLQLLVAAVMVVMLVVVVNL